VGARARTARAAVPAAGHARPGRLHEESGHRHAVPGPRRDAVEPTLAGALDVARADGVLDGLRRDRFPDITRTVDSVVFYFRNDMHTKCLADACGEASVANSQARSRSSRGTCPPGGSFRSVSTTASSTETGSPWASKAPSLRLQPHAARAHDGAATSSTIGGVRATRWSSPPTGQPELPPGSTSTDKYCVMRQLYSQF